MTILSHQPLIHDFLRAIERSCDYQKNNPTYPCQIYIYIYIYMTMYIYPYIHDKFFQGVSQNKMPFWVIVDISISS